MMALTRCKCGRDHPSYETHDDAVRRLERGRSLAACNGEYGSRSIPMPGPQKSTAEQQARDMLEGCGVEDAQSFTAGDVVEIANLIRNERRQRHQLDAIRHQCVDFTPDPSVVLAILAILDETGQPT